MSIKSMSGYGKGIMESDNLKITLEIKSVNHRFLDIYTRSPKQLNFADEIIKNTLKEKGINRGHLDIFIQLDYKEQENLIKLDKKVLDKYLSFFEDIREIGDSINKTDKVVNLPDLLLLDGVIKKEDIVLSDDELKKSLQIALELACDNLIDMRTQEGKKLVKDILQKLKYVDTLIKEIEKHSEDYKINYKQKLIDKINESLNVDVDLDRINQEIVIYADKVGIDEELTRLKSHTQQYIKILEKESSPIGKKLDYLTQELNRESNTISAKCSNIEISNYVVELKTTVEKIREQIQNIE